MLSADRLRHLLDYDADTGVFRWRLSRGGSARAGDIAGGIDSHGYVRISVDCERYLGHRLAWLHIHGAWPEHDLDHRNGIRTDNRISNLREASRSNNLANRAASAASGMKGVYWQRQNRRWYSRISVQGRDIHLGTFDTPEEAHQAFMSASRQHYGEFARA